MYRAYSNMVNSFGRASAGLRCLVHAVICAAQTAADAARPGASLEHHLAPDYMLIWQMASKAMRMGMLCISQGHCASSLALRTLVAGTTPSRTLVSSWAPRFAGNLGVTASARRAIGKLSFTMASFFVMCGSAPA